VAVAIVMLSATTAFAAYGAGLNAVPPPEETDVGQLNELIVALQEENAELNGQVATLSDEVGELQEQLARVIAKQVDNKDMLKGGPIQVDFNTTEKFSFEKVEFYSSLAEANEDLGAPFKTVGWVPQGTVLTGADSLGGYAGGLITSALYPVMVIDYKVPGHSLQNNFRVNVVQYYFGPNHKVVNINTVYDMETVEVGGIEVIVIYVNETTLRLCWMDEDCVFFSVYVYGFDLAAALSVSVLMSAPVPAK